MPSPGFLFPHLESSSFTWSLPAAPPPLSCVSLDMVLTEITAWMRKQALHLPSSQECGLEDRELGKVMAGTEGREEDVERDKEEGGEDGCHSDKDRHF